jgi:hypothetical protein
MMAPRAGDSACLEISQRQGSNGTGWAALAILKEAKFRGKRNSGALSSTEVGPGNIRWVLEMPVGERIVKRLSCSKGQC